MDPNIDAMNTGDLHIKAKHRLDSPSQGKMNNHSLLRDDHHQEYHDEDHDDDHDDFDHDDFDHDEFDNNVTDYTAFNAEPRTSKVSKNDANSFVGGDTLSANEKRTFSFQLPFGHINFKFKIPSLPINIGNIPNISNLTINPFKDDPDPIVDDIRLKLSRQELIGTMDEANYFKKFKTSNDVRLRAVKQSITNKYSGLLSNNALPDYESIYSKLSGNIVILGGYRGSVLRDAKTNKMVWVPLKAGFRLRKVSLLLGPDKQDELDAHKLLYPDGILKNVGPIDLCKVLLKKLNNGKTNVYEFGYDWRLSGELVGKQLIEFLQDIYRKTGEPTRIIAHSMGGLIAHYAVQHHPELIKSMVYVGVPLECLNILGPIRIGDLVLFSDKILTAEANFMMRSSFNFLPLSGNVFYNRHTHEPYTLDLFDADTWVEYNLNPLVGKDRFMKKPSTGYFLRFKLMMDSIQRPNSPTNHNNNPPRSPKSPKLSPKEDTFIKTKSDSLLSSLTFTNNGNNNVLIDDDYSISFDQAYNYLATTLAETKKFILGLDYNPDLESQYPPMAIVYGNTIPSVRGSNVSSPQDIVDGNYWDFFYGHGDGVVHQKWLMPQKKGFEIFDETTGKGQIVGKFASKRGHVDLMSDIEVMGEALNALYEAEKIWPDYHKPPNQDADVSI